MCVHFISGSMDIISLSTTNPAIPFFPVSSALYKQWPNIGLNSSWQQAKPVLIRPHLLSAGSKYTGGTIICISCITIQISSEKRQKAIRKAAFGRSCWIQLSSNGCLSEHVTWLYLCYGETYSGITFLWVDYTSSRPTATDSATPVERSGRLPWGTGHGSLCSSPSKSVKFISTLCTGWRNLKHDQRYT